MSDSTPIEEEQPLSDLSSHSSENPSQDDRIENGMEKEDLPHQLAAFHLEQLQKMQKEVDEYKKKYLEALAEGENARKRLHREREEQISRATQELLLDFLQPIDQMSRALVYAESSSEEVRNWAIGFEMIMSQFKNTLHNHGVRPFESIGHPFDPHSHEAVEVIESNVYGEGTVIEELLCGYKMGDGRVLRPARVIVAKRKKIAPESSHDREKLSEHFEE